MLQYSSKDRRPHLIGCADSNFKQANRSPLKLYFKKLTRMSCGILKKRPSFYHQFRHVDAHTVVVAENSYSVEGTFLGE